MEISKAKVYRSSFDSVDGREYLDRYYKSNNRNKHKHYVETDLFPRHYILE